MIVWSGLRLGFLAVGLVAPFIGGYPATPRGTAVDTYFGTRVPDPYRWLEDIRSPQTRHWVQAQTGVTERALAKISDRSTMRSLVVRLMGSRHDDLPWAGGSVSAFSRSDGSGRLPYVVLAKGSHRSIIIDPNRRWPDGGTSLADWQLAPNGHFVAYATNRGGLGLVRWHVLDVATRRDRADLVMGVPDWAPIVWGADGQGFYYGGYPAEKLPPQGAPIGTGYSVRFHRIGEGQSADRLVFERPDRPNWLPYASQSGDGRYEIVGAINGSDAGTFLAVRDLNDNRAVLQKIRSARYDYVANAGPVLYFFTTVGAPRGQLVAIDLRRPSRARLVIASHAETLEDVTAVKGRFIARYIRDDQSHLVAYGEDGTKLGDIGLPGPGSVPEVRGSPNRSIAYFQFSSPTSPPRTYSYDSRTGRTSVLARDPAPFDTSEFVTEEAFARSGDGTRVPVFIAHRRGLPMDGSVPTLLTGYGGFGYAYLPQWGTLGAAWLKRGGTFAIAIVRGGGEYGEAWHRAGMRGNKHHVFEDLVAVARLLVARGFASPRTLGLYGYSGGGLLVGTTEVQHPHQFGAVVEAAGPVDVLRGHSYGSESFWSTEVGSPVASKSQFRWLYDYAPLLHIRKGVRYPPTMVTTEANDQRVFPAHAYKFAATMQWAQGGPAPILLYVARGTGHIGGGTLIEQAAPLADAETFLLAHLARWPR